MVQANLDVIKEKGNIPYWKIAYELKISENTLMRWMRLEMDHEKKDMVLQGIRRVKGKGNY